MLTSFKKLMIRATSICLLLFTSSTFATVLSFDDLTSNTGFTNLSGTNYGALNWSSDFYILSTPGYTTSGYQNGTVSGDYVALNGFASDVSISDGFFNFVGAFFTAAWNDGLSIRIQGLSGASVLYDQTIVVDTTGPLWFDANFIGIDTLTFSSFGGTNAGFNGAGTHFAMDDFTFDTATNVPTPATLFLMALGGLFLLRRNK